MSDTITLTDPDPTEDAPPAGASTEDLLARARAVGEQIAAAAARHDREGSVVAEALPALRAAGLLSMAVPVELGGLGATPRQVAAVQRELARHCGSTGLATAMHQHVVAFTAWRYRRSLPGAEATLRRVADEGLVLLSTGGADFTAPRGEAVAVDGGYRVTGRKVFVSLSTEGDVLSTMFAYDDPDEGRRVLNMAVPVADPGVTIADNWDTLGMRGTASNDVVIDDVFVPAERVLANRPWGVVDPPLQVIASIAMPIISAAYLGVADAAFEAAVAAATARASDPLVQRQVGAMAHRLKVAGWALDHVLDEVGDDPAPSEDLYTAVMIAKREVALAGIEVCDEAMELAGGAAFFKGSPIERAYRDIRAAKFHPTTPEETLRLAGRRALGLGIDEG
jgi:alkylation response protein AidB-like acyl-CoA dehydrogenase